MVLEQSDICGGREKKNLDLSLSSYMKTDSEWITNLNVKYENIKLSEKK